MPEPSTEIVQRILDAARAAFERHGVSKTRMGHVADEAECSRATLYRYFATKDALVLAYAERELELTGARVLARARKQRRLGDRLVEAIVAATEAVRESPAIRPFLAPEEQSMTMTLPIAGTAMTPSLLATLLGVVGEHDGTERLRPTLPPDELLEWVVRLVLSLAMVPGRDRSRTELRGFVERLVRPAFVEPAG